MGRRGREWASAIALSAIGLVTMLSAGESAAAGGGRYHVYSCRMPDGEVAPVDGWSGARSMASDKTEDTCGNGGALIAALTDGATHEVETDHATWTLTAPPDSTIVAATLWRAGDANGGWVTNATYEFWLAGPEDKDVKANVFDQCVAEFGCPTGLGETSNVKSASNLVSILPEYLGNHLYVNVSCAGSAGFSCPAGKDDPNGYAAVVYLYAADLVLEQSSAPTVTPGSVSGELASASTVSGKPTLLFEAKDSGSGVYQAVVSVDEKVVGATTLDSNGGHCADVGQTTDGLPAFLYLQPCAQSVSADVPLDTTALANGSHRIVVTVTNAAGNSVVVLDRVIAVANVTLPQGSVTTTSNAPVPLPKNEPAPQGQPTNGQNATPLASLLARWSSTQSPDLYSRYGRAQTIVGRLLAPSGTPIGGALIEATLTPSSQGARSAALASVRTSADGTFRLRLPASAPSSTVSIAYRGEPGAPVPSASAALKLTVAAGLTLRVTPRTSHVGGTIHFSGTLHGGPIPPEGKQIVLQASSPGVQWRTFEAIATDRRGRYRASYRFHFSGPVTYRFRALSPAEADFPFAAGSSNVVRVRER